MVVALILFATWAYMRNSIWSNPASVSYTHLRAHETVLDLVCRLLLEKKNNTNDNANY